MEKFDDYVKEDPEPPKQFCHGCQNDPRSDTKIAWWKIEPHPDCLVCGGTGDPYKFNQENP